jgi:hypothetical protein
MACSDCGSISILTMWLLLLLFILIIRVLVNTNRGVAPRHAPHERPALLLLLLLLRLSPLLRLVLLRRACGMAPVWRMALMLLVLWGACAGEQQGCTVG